MDLWVFRGQLAGHQGNIIGACHMSVNVKTTTIYKCSVVHAKSFGTLIHFFYESGFTAADKFRHGNACVIGTCDADTFDHGVDGLRFIRFQKDLRATHAGSVF